MASEERKRCSSVFHPSFIDWLDDKDEPPSMPEAEWSGEWKVFSLADDRHLVLRAWEDPTRDSPAAIFCERSTALLCAAVLPLEARPTLFILSRPAEPNASSVLLVRDTYSPEVSPEPVGQVRVFSESQLFALHLASGLTRSPFSLALVLEAAGPSAIRLVGEILHRRLGLSD